MALGKDYTSQNCSLARALEVVGERWTLLVVRDAFYGVRRYSDFQVHLGMPRAVLVDRLQTLERAGVLKKQPYQEAPQRHEYVLTSSGLALWPVVRSMIRWGEENLDGARRLRVFVHTSCGTELGSGGECPACGVPSVEPGDVEMLPGPDLDTTRRDSDAVSRALFRPHRLLRAVAVAPQRSATDRSSRTP
jgi:DNA-binding HxlR family transcriptional regulator